MPTTTTKKIRFGHSPDPDDAFMFYAFEKKTIPMQGFEVSHVMADIETLNQRALGVGSRHALTLLEVTAVSCHAYAYLADQYAVMRSGASIGDGYGPILVAKGDQKNQEPRTKSQEGKSLGSRLMAPGSIKGKRIAVPGKLTTAYLALQIYSATMHGGSAAKFGGEKNFETVFTPFDEILNVVESGEVDFGLVIHEGQLTYQNQGLAKVLDLGVWWQEKYDCPLPLGVDVIRKDLGTETMQAFAKLFRASIEHSLQNRKPALDYAMKYGRGLTHELNDQFVGMYVNDFTVDLGPRGEKGFQKLLDEGYAKGLIPHQVEIEFVG